MINSITIKSGILVIGLFLTANTFAQKGKPKKNIFLDGKKYDVQFTEKKATALGKPLPGLIILKGGQIQCDLMEEKLKAPSMAYKVTLDTTYVEDESDVHKVSFTAESTEAKTGYKWEATITDYDIEGTVIMLKSDVEKKRFEFAGGEKAKKK